MTTTIVLRLEIRGLVQGVAYRRSMAEKAEALGVRGWVRNRTDGSVEATVAGSHDVVQQIIEWAHRGPQRAVVSAVHSYPAEGSFAEFCQLPTV